MTSKCCYVLPSAIEDGLVEDDSINYSLFSYPPDVAMKCCSMILSAVDSNADSVLLDTEHRIDFLMEFLGLALSSSIENIETQKIACKIYKSWVHDPEFMGEKAQQNRYFRRIIRHLSQPFALENIEECETDFLPHFLYILDIYKEFMAKKSQLESETWVVLLNVMIGICDRTLMMKSNEKLMQLKKTVISVYFLSFYYSNISDKSLWDKFHLYGAKWSSRPEFVEYWGFSIIRVFKLMASKLYGIEAGTEMQLVIDDESLPIVFSETLSVYKFDESNVDAGECLARTVSNLAGTAIDIGLACSNFYVMKFSAASFLKLFGVFLNIFPESNEYDSLLSINLQTVCHIIEYFDLTNTAGIIQDLLTRYIKYLTDKYPRLLMTFIHNSSVFAKDKKLLSMAAALVENNIMEVLKIGKTGIATKIVSLAWSAYSVTKDHEKIAGLLEKVWNQEVDSAALMSILCSSDIVGFDSTSAIIQLLEHSKDCSVVAKVACFLSVSMRFTKMLDVMKIYPELMSKVGKYGVQNPEYESLVASILLFVLSITTWRPEVFSKPENITMFFDVHEIIMKAIDVAEKSKTFSSLIDKRKNFMKFISRFIMIRLNVHFPMKYIYSKTYGDDVLVNESMLIKTEKLSNAKVTYVTVRDTNLLSFIEDDKDQLYIMARGAFGKAFWKVRDASESITENILAKEKHTPLPSSSDIDLAVRKQFRSQFENWLSWETYNFEDTSKTSTECMRSRVADFLICGGLLDIENSNRVALIPESEELTNTITKFDALWQPCFITVPVLHLNSTETSLSDAAKNWKLPTQGLQTFLRDVGNPVVIPHQTAQNLKLPKLRTVLPTISNDYSVFGFITPAMAFDDKGATAVVEMLDTSDFIVIFNEGNRDLVKMKEFDGKAVVEIRPIGNSLYTIAMLATPRGVFIPIDDGVVIAGRDLKFIISIITDQIIQLRQDDLLLSTLNERETVIKALVPETIDTTLCNSVITKCQKPVNNL